MTNPITEDDIQAFVDSALTQERYEEVHAHLERNPEEAARVSALQRQASALRSALARVLDEPVPERLSLTHMLPARRRHSPPKWQMAAAAVVLLTAGVGGGWTMRDYSMPAAGGVAALAQEASASYQAFAAESSRPVEVSANDPFQLASFARTTTGRETPLPDLSGSGYRLMGGRAVATVHGPGLMLVYENTTGGRLVILTRRMLVDQNKAMTEHTDNVVHGWSWAKDGMGYSLVGSPSPDVLHPIADEIRSQVSRI